MIISFSTNNTSNFGNASENGSFIKKRRASKAA